MEEKPLKLAELIRTSVERTDGPYGEEITVISVAATQRLSEQTGASPRTVEITALENGIVPLRYLRNQSTYSSHDQIRFLQSRVAIVGLGGLGGVVIEILARAGVGALTLIDGDRFETHNLNRQLVSTQANLGASKAVAASNRVMEINASVESEVHAAFFSSTNGAELIDGADVVVDCLDNIASRFAVEETARAVGIPFVSAAVAGMTGHVTVIFPQDRGLQLVYGPRENARHAKGAELLLGCPPQTVVMVAAKQSAEVLNILCGRTGQLLRNKLWVIDLSDHTAEVLTLTA